MPQVRLREKIYETEKMTIFEGFFYKSFKNLLTNPFCGAKLFVSNRNGEEVCPRIFLHTDIFTFIIITQGNVIKVICAV